MSQPKKRALFYISLVVLGLAWLIITRAPETQTSGAAIPQTGFLAPDFTLQTLDGESITLSKLRGKAILVNYWASWCLPCQAEMPAMQRVYQDYHDQGFEILAVNAANQDSINNVQAFVAAKGLRFPILLDSDGQVGAAYNINSLPTSFFIAPDGRISEIVIGGPMSEALLRIRIETLLEATP